MPVNSYSHGGRTVIAFRALPGAVSTTAIHSPAGAIGRDKFDSYRSGGVFVIRRTCQALPCFLVHY
jgi:hypothetical protein